MNINLKGHTLNQRQLDAIVPVMNDLMRGRVSEKKFEEASISALEAAGCGLGYDTGIPGADASVMARAEGWLLNGRVGMSSRSIYAHMTGREPKDRWAYPSDPDDLNRCLLLLDLMPEWEPRMQEMAAHGKAWAGLAEQWGLIAETFIAEVGLDWCNGKSAPKTYALMKAAIGAHREPGVFHVSL